MAQMTFREERLVNREWEARFWSFVNRDGPVNVAELGKCWEWTGSKSKQYGQLQIGTHERPVPEKAHRLSWVIHYGVIPRGAHVLHKCDWQPCCNPAHLFLGSPKDNAEDRERKGRGGATRFEALAKAVARSAELNRGKKRPPRSLEWRRRLSAAMTGKSPSLETREKLRAANIGKKHGPRTPETCARISAAKKAAAEQRRATRGVT